MEKNLVIITGASKGFGQCLADDFTQQLTGELFLFLLARTLDGLNESKAIVEESWKNKGYDINHLHVSLLQVDLSVSSDYVPKIDTMFDEITKYSRFDKAFLVNNAGSIGEIGLVHEYRKISTLQEYFELNLVSVAWINKKFVAVFGGSGSIEDGKAIKDQQNAVIINVSSLWAVEPCASVNLYCTAKAGRDMHHKVIAEEQSSFPHFKTLNYSPGPMDTDMQGILRSTNNFVGKKDMIAMNEQGTLVSPKDSSKLCVGLVLSGDYKSGAHVDYYDIKGNQE